MPQYEDEDFDCTDVPDDWWDCHDDLLYISIRNKREEDYWTRL